MCACAFPSKDESAASTHPLRPRRCFTRSRGSAPYTESMPNATLALDRASADIQLSKAAREDLERAASEASRRDAEESNPVDVLRAVLSNRSSLAVSTLRSLGADPAAVAAALPADGVATPLPLRQLLVNANREAQVLGHYQVDSIHLLLAMLYSDSPSTSGPLQQAGLTLYDVRRHLQTGSRAGVPNYRDPTRPDTALRKRPWPSLRGVLGISPVFVVIVGATAASGALLWTNLLPRYVALLTILFVVGGWITSLCIHEFGHAFVAYLGGDRSVASAGYLSLNPLKYTHPVLSIALPVVFLLIGGIGLPGGAVYLNERAIRTDWWRSFASAGGPLGNLLFAILIGWPFLVFQGLPPFGDFHFWAALAFLVFLQLTALLLNLIPIPPFDGFGIIAPWLSIELRMLANRLGMLPLLVLFYLLWQHAEAIGKHPQFDR